MVAGGFAVEMKWSNRERVRARDGSAVKLHTCYDLMLYNILTRIYISFISIMENAKWNVFHKDFITKIVLTLGCSIIIE